LENEKPSIGTRTEDTVKYYIDRTLQCTKQTNTRFPAQGEIQTASSVDIVQDVRHNIPNSEENLGKATTKVWKPSTLLEGEGQTILIIDEPGIGKSTLLTHLAQQTREIHPDMWIVKVNINNYTRILNEMQINGCDENGVIKLLTEAAEIKKIDGVFLEGRIFNYIYNSTGNMAVLIDGVDEVSPRYTEELIQVLKILSKTKIKRIWITSRNSVSDRLETEFQCQSYSLVPFSEEDQKIFLVKFWKETCPEVEDEYLENLARRVVKLATEQLTVHDEKFMGIPLQSWLLAETFERNVKEHSISKTVDLPEHINIVMLYDLYVEKKWEIYLSGKMFYDGTNVMVRNDIAKLRKTFIHNHRTAALVAILSTQQLQKLNDKTIAEGARVFLQKITTGVEKTGVITEVIEGRPVFQHHTLAEYLAATWLCDNFQNGQTFMRDHLFESGFHVVRRMVDRILADKCPLHEAVLNSSFIYVENLLRKKGSIPEKDRGGRTPLHVAVSCRSPEIIKLLLEHRADVSSVDTLLGLTPVQYAIRMDVWEMLSLLMEKRPDIREQVLNGANRDCGDNIACALRAAAQYGHNYLLKYLISNGSSVNVALPGDNSTLLHVAARSQQIETVKILLLLGASTDCQDESGKTPLHVSVETGNFEVIKCLVEHQKTVQSETELQQIVNPERTGNRGNFLKVRDVDGNTPLHLGVAAGNINIVSYLVSAGSDFNTCNKQGDYPLTLAARCGNNDIVEILMEGEVQCEEAQIDALRAAIEADQVDTTALLLRLGVPVNIGEKEKPIHVASRLGREEIVSLLLQFGASLTSLTNTGNTALHLASEAGHLSLVKYLVEKDRGGLCSLNYEKETPLHLAARNGRDYLVSYCAENGCNINATSANGSKCFHLACEDGHYTTVECLLKHGAEVNATNSADQTPVHTAASRGQTRIVELLILHKANFSLRDKDGLTAVLAASINGHLDTVRVIVQHGGNIEDTDRKGNTIAHFAVTNESYDILNFLSQQNVNLDVQNSDGDTPLLIAVREGRNRVLEYLAAKQCNINTKGKDGMRPLDIAVLKDNMEIIRLLIERNARSFKSGMHIVVAARLGFLDLLQCFLSMGDDINVKDDNGEIPLHAASKSGHAATVKYLCEHGALMNLQDNNGNTALHVAVTNEHFDVTRILVEKGANLCAADASGSTALHIAAKGGYLNIVQYLAESFAPIDRRNAKNETALLMAAAEGHEKIVSVLIEQGAGIGVRDIEGKTALDIATDKGYTAITQMLKDRAEGRKLVSFISNREINTFSERDNVECLKGKINAGASADSATDRNDTDSERMFKTTAEDAFKFQSNPRSALHTAAVNGNLEEVQRLVECGIALDYGDPFGRTALWVAAKSGHKLIIRFLLQNGSCVNIPDCEGVRPTDIAVREGHWAVVNEFLEHDPEIRLEGTEIVRNKLHEASESGEQEVVRIILKCGTNVNTNNKNGNTPLHVAAKCGNKEVTSLLLKCGANINTADNDGKTPLILAAENGFVEIVRELLRATNVIELSKPLQSAAKGGHKEVVQELLYHGANANTADEKGITPMFIASLKGHVEVVRELLQHGAKVNTATKEGFTPLYVAGQEGHVEVVRELLQHGANVNTANKDGFSPLYVAGEKGHVEVVRELLQHGANVNNATKDGSTTLHVACYIGHVEVLRELLQHGANVNTETKDGRTPLRGACYNGHVKVV
jgi:serine/threonine-protein phosphatase 6 regulatory ankyrin repeat subunit B